MKRICILLVLFAVLFFVAAAEAEITSKWHNGFLEYYDTSTGETVDVLAHDKVFPVWTSSSSWSLTPTFNLTVVNSGTAVANNGVVEVRTGAADNDNVEIATDVYFTGSKFAVVETHLAIQPGLTAFFFGFTDAITEGADDIPIMHEGGTIVALATDAAGIFYDPEQASGTGDYVVATTVKDGVLVTPITATAALTTVATPVTNTFYVYKVTLDDSGNADFWFNNHHLGRKAAGITASDNLCAYLGFINRAGVVQYATPTYVRAWQKRE